MGSRADIRQKQMAGLTGPHNTPQSFSNYAVGTSDSILSLTGNKCGPGNSESVKSFRLASSSRGLFYAEPPLSGLKRP